MFPSIYSIWWAQVYLLGMNWLVPPILAFCILTMVFDHHLGQNKGIFRPKKSLESFYTHDGERYIFDFMFFGNSYRKKDTFVLLVCGQCFNNFFLNLTYPNKILEINKICFSSQDDLFKKGILEAIAKSFSIFSMPSLSPLSHTLSLSLSLSLSCSWKIIWLLNGLCTYFTYWSWGAVPMTWEPEGEEPKRPTIFPLRAKWWPFNNLPGGKDQGLGDDFPPLFLRTCFLLICNKEIFMKYIEWSWRRFLPNNVQFGQKWLLNWLILIKI